jgi:hypothetical protein
LQLGLDNVREFPGFQDRYRRLFAHHRSRWRWSGSRLSNLSCLAQGAEMFPNFISKFVVERTGMRLLLYP